MATLHAAVPTQDSPAAARARYAATQQTPAPTQRSPLPLHRHHHHRGHNSHTPQSIWQTPVRAAYAPPQQRQQPPPYMNASPVSTPGNSTGTYPSPQLTPSRPASLRDRRRGNTAGMPFMTPPSFSPLSSPAVYGYHGEMPAQQQPSPSMYGAGAQGYRYRSSLPLPPPLRTLSGPTGPSVGVRAPWTAAVALTKPGEGVHTTSDGRITQRQRHPMSSGELHEVSVRPHLPPSSRTTTHTCQGHPSTRLARSTSSSSNRSVSTANSRGNSLNVQLVAQALLEEKAGLSTPVDQRIPAMLPPSLDVYNLGGVPNGGIAGAADGDGGHGRTSAGAVEIAHGGLERDTAAAARLRLQEGKSGMGPSTQRWSAAVCEALRQSMAEDTCTYENVMVRAASHAETPRPEHTHHYERRRRAPSSVAQNTGLPSVSHVAAAEEGNQELGADAGQTNSNTVTPAASPSAIDSGRAEAAATEVQVCEEHTPSERSARASSIPNLSVPSLNHSRCGSRIARAASGDSSEWCSPSSVARAPPDGDSSDDGGSMMMMVGAGAPCTPKAFSSPAAFYVDPVVTCSTPRELPVSANAVTAAVRPVLGPVTTSNGHRDHYHLYEHRRMDAERGAEFIAVYEKACKDAHDLERRHKRQHNRHRRLSLSPSLTDTPVLMDETCDRPQVHLRYHHHDDFLFSVDGADDAGMAEGNSGRVHRDEHGQDTGCAAAVALLASLQNTATSVYFSPQVLRMADQAATAAYVQDGTTIAVTSTNTTPQLRTPRALSNATHVPVDEVSRGNSVTPVGRTPARDEWRSPLLWNPRKAQDEVEMEDAKAVAAFALLHYQRERQQQMARLPRAAEGEEEEEDIRMWMSNASASRCSGLPRAVRSGGNRRPELIDSVRGVRTAVALSTDPCTMSFTPASPILPTGAAAGATNAHARLLSALGLSSEGVLDSAEASFTGHDSGVDGSLLSLTASSQQQQQLRMTMLWLTSKPHNAGGDAATSEEGDEEEESVDEAAVAEEEEWIELLLHHRDRENEGSRIHRALTDSAPAPTAAAVAAPTALTVVSASDGRSSTVTALAWWATSALLREPEAAGTTSVLGALASTTPFARIALSTSRVSRGGTSLLLAPSPFSDPTSLSLASAPSESSSRAREPIGSALPPPPARLCAAMSADTAARTLSRLMRHHRWRRHNLESRRAAAALALRRPMYALRRETSLR